MAIEQPASTDPLNSPAHHSMHRIIAVDNSADVQTITVDSSNVTRIGDADGSNYTKIEADGTVEFNGDATVVEDVNFEAILLARAAAAPDQISIFGSGNIQGLAFDGNNRVEALFGGGEIPHAYKEGSNLAPHIHWMPTTANAGNVKWFLEYNWQLNANTFGAPTTVSIVDAATGTAWDNIQTDIASISGTGMLFNSHFVFRLYRDPNDAEDTYPDDAVLLSIGLHYEIDTVGSRTVNTK